MTKKTIQKNKRKKGFTLVECVVAIAVILLISSTALSIYTLSQPSINNQWDNYQATLQADNAVTCFQSADDFTQFDKRFSSINGSTEFVNTQTIQISGGTYDQTGLEYQIEPIPYGSIKADETGKISFLNNSGTALVTFNYGSKNAAYNTDKAYLDSQATAGVYTSDKTETEFKAASALSYKIYVKGTDESKDGFYPDSYGHSGSGDGGAKVEYYYNGTTLQLKISETNGSGGTNQSKTVTATAFDQYLVKNAYVLRPVEVDGTNAYCEVYHIRSDKSAKRVTENGTPVYYKVTGIADNSTAKNWLNASSTPSVKVYKGTAASGSYKTATYGDLKDGTTNFSSTAFAWRYSLLFNKARVNNSSTSSVLTNKIEITAITTEATDKSETIKITGLKAGTSSVTMVMTDSYVSYTVGSTTVIGGLSEFEKYLFTNHYYLKPTKTTNTSDVTGQKQWYQVYQIDTKTGKATAQSWYIGFKGANFTGSSSSSSWSPWSSAKSTVTAVYKGTGSSYYNSTTTLESGKFGSFKLGCYPYISTCSTSATLTCTYSGASEMAAVGLNYTTYVPKTDENKKVLYAQSDKTDSASTYVEVYSAAGTLLYKCTGTVGTNVPGMGSFGFNSTETITEGTLYKHFKKITLDIPTTVAFNDANKETIYRANNGATVIGFRFTDATKYTDAKESIAVSNYTYGPYYTGTGDTRTIQYVAKTKDGQNNYTRVGSLIRKVGTQLQLLDKLKYTAADSTVDETEAEIFGVGVDDVEVYTSAGGTEKPLALHTETESGITATAATKTKYYKWVNGVYGCLIRVTYSNAPYNTASEPLCRIWIMKAADLQAISSDTINELANENVMIQQSNMKAFEESLGDPYINYHKG